MNIKDGFKVTCVQDERDYVEFKRTIADDKGIFIEGTMYASGGVKTTTIEMDKNSAINLAKAILEFQEVQVEYTKTRLEELEEYCELLVKKDLSLSLKFALPYSEDEHCETIVVPCRYIKKKLDYIKSTYNPDLTMKSNNKVKIVGYY